MTIQAYNAALQTCIEALQANNAILKACDKVLRARNEALLAVSPAGFAQLPGLGCLEGFLPDRLPLCVLSVFHLLVDGFERADIPRGHS